jgi:Leucine-rich repeat (LRR) protein
MLGKFGSRTAVVLFCSIACIGSSSANELTSHKLKAPAGEKRTFEFKGEKSLGTLYLEPANTHCSIDGTQVGTALGKVTIFVPENSRLIYEPNALVITHPKLMAGITPHGIDVFQLTAVEMDESENGKCDRVIESAAKQFKELRELVVDGSDVTDAGLAHLRNMPNLEAISTMSCFFVKGECFPILVKLPNLQRLSFRGHPLNASSFKYLPSFPKLTFLNLRATRMNTAEIKDVAQCSQLTELDLDENKTVDDNCLAALSPLKHLRSLRVGGTSVTDRGIVFLLRFPMLKSLDLDKTSITLKGLAALKPLKLDNLTVSSRFTPLELQRIGPLSSHIFFATQSKSVDKDLQVDFAPLR